MNFRIKPKYGSEKDLSKAYYFWSKNIIFGYDRRRRIIKIVIFILNDHFVYSLKSTIDLYL